MKSKRMPNEPELENKILYLSFHRSYLSLGHFFIEFPITFTGLIGGTAGCFQNTERGCPGKAT